MLSCGKNIYLAYYGVNQYPRRIAWGREEPSKGMAAAFPEGQSH